MNTDRHSIESVLVEFLGQWTKWYDADVSETNKGRVFYLHHVLGKKWSVFLKNFFEQALTELLNLKVSIETTENSIIFTMPNETRQFKTL